MCVCVCMYICKYTNLYIYKTHIYIHIRILVYVYNPKVIVLVESWLSEDTVNIYKYKNFQQFSMSRVNKSGGGVMLFLHPNYSAVKVNAPVVPPASCDVLAVAETRSDHCWVVVYRPPACSAEDALQLCECLGSILAQYCNVTLMEDFNAPSIDWASTDEAQRLKPSERSLLLFCLTWDLRQLVDKPTREASTLELIFTTHPEQFGEVHVEPPIVSSDHDTVICDIVDAATDPPPTNVLGQASRLG